MIAITVTTPARGSAGFDEVTPVADAILYEGYLLYPYRRSSPKNKVRWQFGVLLPQPWAEAHGLDDSGMAGSAESWWQQTECLLAGPPRGTVRLRLRFLQQQRRSLERRNSLGCFEPIDRAVVGDRLELSFDEAVPLEHDVVVQLRDLLDHEVVTEVAGPAGTVIEPVADTDDHRVVRRTEAVAATLIASATECEGSRPLTRLRVQVRNVGEITPDLPRDEALHHAMLATHLLISADDATFVSLLDPPAWAHGEAKASRNVHTFPVLADTADRVVLSAPVILYDHPQVAPESPGDLHDATEIDEILSLRTLTLTDEEKAEARATDPRAAAIVDRVDTLPPEVFERLHGAIRTTGVAEPPIPAGPAPEQSPWWAPEADDALCPETDEVAVGGRPVRRGSRVRLHPREHGTDVHDMFLAGRVAVVEKVLLDVDGERHVVVSVEDDPATELNQWYGRYRYFTPDEVEPL